MNYGGSHHFPNSQGNDQSRHRLNVAPPMPSNLWHLIPLNVDSSDGVIHHISTPGRLPYPPDDRVAHFMAYNMINNRLPTAPLVTGGQIPSDIILQFDDPQAIDQSISTGVVANPVHYSYEANELSAHIGQLANLTLQTPTEAMIQDGNPPTDWVPFSTPPENLSLNPHGHSSDSDGENQTGGGNTVSDNSDTDSLGYSSDENETGEGTNATTANYHVHVFAVTPVLSHPDVFTRIYYQDNSSTSVAEFLRYLPIKGQRKISRRIEKLEEDELVENLYYYDPRRDIDGGTTTTFRSSRFAEDQRVVQDPGLQFAWNRREEGSYVGCKICCRKLKLSELFSWVNWKRHKRICQARLPSLEEKEDAPHPDDDIDQAFGTDFMTFPRNAFFDEFDDYLT